MRFRGGAVFNCWGSGAVKTASLKMADDSCVTKVNHFTTVTQKLRQCSDIRGLKGEVMRGWQESLECLDVLFHAFPQPTPWRPALEYWRNLSRW